MNWNQLNTNTPPSPTQDCFWAVRNDGNYRYYVGKLQVRNNNLVIKPYGMMPIGTNADTHWMPIDQKFELKV